VSTCEKCGQDHHAANVCQGRRLGQAPKDPDAQRAKANKRWAAWRLLHPVWVGPGPDRPAESKPEPALEAKKTWRW